MLASHRVHAVAAVVAATALVAAGFALPAVAAGDSTGPTAAALLPPPRTGARVWLRPADGTFTVDGHGWGHGVGLSQYGALGAAKSGVGYRDILAKYYPGTTVTTVTGAIKVRLSSNGANPVQVKPGTGLTLTPAGLPAVALPQGAGAPSSWRLVPGTAAGTVALQGFDGEAWLPAAVAGATGDLPAPAYFTGPAGQALSLVRADGTLATYDGSLGAGFSAGKLVTVNALDIDAYVAGVLPREMPASWPREALRAQAVAARSYAARTMGGPGSYDICDTTSCQVYGPISTTTKTGAVTNLRTATSEAVARTDTAGQVLSYGDQIATTMFSAANGGWTSARPGVPYLPAQADPWDALDTTGLSTWSAALPLNVLEKKYGLAQLLRVQVTKREGTGAQWGGRVLGAVLDGVAPDGGLRSVTISGQDVKNAYPWPIYRADGLKSNWWNLRDEPAAPAPSPSPPPPPPAPAPAPTQTPTPTPTVTPTAPASTPTIALRYGARGSLVGSLQRTLKVSADGIFGAKTKAAVVAAQQRVKLPATGVADARLWRALKLPAQALAAPTLKYGARNEAVLDLQVRLKIKPTSGWFGPSTKQKVLAFQKARKLPVTGVVDARTWRALGG